MSRQFRLVTQHPKPAKVVGLGVLDVDRKTREATFFSGEGGAADRVLATMQRVQLDFAAAHGIMLSGFEVTGHDRTGRQKLGWQEWWLAYVS